MTDKAIEAEEPANLERGLRNYLEDQISKMVKSPESEKVVNFDCSGLLPLGLKVPVLVSVMIRIGGKSFESKIEARLAKKL
jgi:hypothetical protein